MTGVDDTTSLVTGIFSLLNGCESICPCMMVPGTWHVCMTAVHVTSPVCSETAEDLKVAGDAGTIRAPGNTVKKAEICS